MKDMMPKYHPNKDKYIVSPIVHFMKDETWSSLSSLIYT